MKNHRKHFFKANCKFLTQNLIPSKERFCDDKRKLVQIRLINNSFATATRVVCAIMKPTMIIACSSIVFDIFNFWFANYIVFV